MAIDSITTTPADSNSAENCVDDALLTVQDAARFLNVTASWIYEHVRDGAEDRLPVVKIGKYLRFHQRDLRDYIDAKRDASRMRRRRR